jgi:regulator of replication initiation timing
MRKQLRQTGEELAAVKLERDGLRQRLRQTEANLNSALKGESAHAVTTEVMKRVDRIMRETPKPNQGE